MKLFRAALAALALAMSAQASGHPTLENPRAEAGSTYRAAIRLSHGCSGSPVREVIVEIPESVRGAKPMPKPGWQIAIEPRAIRWSGGSIENGYFDEFVLLAQLPAAPGTLYWKISQVCEKGRIDWTEVPGAGRAHTDLKAPAAALEIIPRQGHGHPH